MRRPAAGIWKARVPALAVCSMCFALGGLIGYLLAASVTGSGGACLTAYLQQFFAAAGEGNISPPMLLPLIWQTIRWPLFAMLLGFTALGILGLPLLFVARGFLLSFSITSFVRMFGATGSLLAFLVFGVSECLAIPVLFVLGVQSLTAASQAAGWTLGMERGGGGYGREEWIRCGLCVCVLSFCVLLEYFVVPILVSGAVRIVRY